MKSTRLLLGFFGVVLLSTLSVRADNIVINGTFETPVIAADNYQYFTNGIPGWQLAWGHSVEIQSGIAGAPYQGNQFVELDSDGSSGIYQTLSTIPGQTYNLSFAFSPRPYIPAWENQLGVLWNGNMVADLGPVGGVGVTQTEWSVYNYALKATGESTRLEFEDLGPSDTYGTYIDSVAVSTAAPEPGSFFLIGGTLIAAAMGLKLFGKKRMIRLPAVSERAV
ncbi:MAG: DUF642 domain-containing protein [Bryobacteraceae bacterium]